MSCLSVRSETMGPQFDYCLRATSKCFNDIFLVSAKALRKTFVAIFSQVSFAGMEFMGYGIKITRTTKLETMENLTYGLFLYKIQNSLLIYYFVIFVIVYR